MIFFFYCNNNAEIISTKMSCSCTQPAHNHTDSNPLAKLFIEQQHSKTQQYLWLVIQLAPIPVQMNNSQDERKTRARIHNSQHTTKMSSVKWKLSNFHLLFSPRIVRIVCACVFGYMGLIIYFYFNVFFITSFGYSAKVGYCLNRLFPWTFWRGLNMFALRTRLK